MYRRKKRQNSGVHYTMEFDDEPREWLPHPDYDELMVSDHGEVYNSRTDHLLTTYPTTLGKHQVKYCTGDGTETNLYIHRLVAATFLLGYDPDYNVVHIDDDYDNNRAENLDMGFIRVRGKNVA